MNDTKSLHIFHCASRMSTLLSVLCKEYDDDVADVDDDDNITWYILDWRLHTSSSSSNFRIKLLILLDLIFLVIHNNVGLLFLLLLLLHCPVGLLFIYYYYYYYCLCHQFITFLVQFCHFYTISISFLYSNVLPFLFLCYLFIYYLCRLLLILFYYYCYYLFVLDYVHVVRFGLSYGFCLV